MRPRTADRPCPSQRGWQTSSLIGPIHFAGIVLDIPAPIIKLDCSSGTTMTYEGKQVPFVKEGADTY